MSEALINDIFRRAHSEGRSALFEHEVYRLLGVAGVGKAPRHEVIAAGTEPTDEQLASWPGSRVVVKIVSGSIAHKSDVGGVAIVPNQPAAVRAACKSMLAELSGRDIAGLMLTEFIEADAAGSGSELLVGIRNTREFGMILSAGMGGVDTELHAASARRGQAVVSASTALTSAEEFLELFRPTIAYRKVAGLTRGGRRLVADETLLQCFGAFIRLANSCSAGDPETDFVIEELEVNPFTCSAGALVALDGLCRFGRPQRVRPPRPQGKIDKLLHPASIGIIGASATRMNFGRITLKNIIASGYDKARLLVINPDGQEVDGVRCVASLGALEKKLDLLILAVTADVAFGIVDEVIRTDAVESVLLIPGGMGETEASREPARRMLATIDEARRAGVGPVFVGANCLGIISHPGNYDSWFIPEERLPRTQKKAQRSSAFISQSGAFLVTRLSKNAWLDPAYMVALGNQNDITHGDMVESFAANPDIHVIGAYVEGFKDLDGLALARAVRKASASGKQVVIYKAGQSAAGGRAAMGHTASIAGDYEVCLSVLTQAGALVASDVSEFSDLFYISDCLRNKVVHGKRLGAVAGAGYDTVAIADSIQVGDFSMSLAAIGAATRERLVAILASKKLDALMEVRNPFDINPGADDEAHLLCTEAMVAEPEVDSVVVGLDPTSPMVRSLQKSARSGFDIDSPESIVQTLPKLVASCPKPIVAFIDGGALFDPMADKLMAQGVCIFRSSERATRALVRYTEARLRAARLRGA
ncbi:MAG: acetate--CoA ligase family protein [Rhodoferax sp.]|uniref:acetate--CoA ligase family protein n=1 Tax=Rhodoferax sp. TaxID=50421 RepID=UPI0026023AAE|nr:acetate--CoA ligase family protein [Rhodoferax sp.]MDD5335375.1 acetate--CoA ligase family protein [Rhodoferax sp.]